MTETELETKLKDSFVLLIILILISLPVGIFLNIAMSMATGAEKPLFHLLDFMLTNPIGIVVDWLIGSLVIFIS